MGVILDSSSGKAKYKDGETFQDVSHHCMLCQIVPGRMGLLVTLFLSLTALLVSTITSSPEVNILFSHTSNEHGLHRFLKV